MADDKVTPGTKTNELSEHIPEAQKAVKEMLTPDKGTQKELSEHIPEAQKAIKEMLSSNKDSRIAKKSGKATLLQKEVPEKIFHTIKFVGDVPLRLYAEVARTEIDLRHILSWKNGSIVKFDKIIGEPVEVLIGNQLIARGEVVVVNNRFGVRISEITRPDEKVGAAHH